MALARDRCICLRKYEYSETSQILLLFARSRGLIRVIAKGAHRVNKNGSSRFGGGIDLLDLGEAVFTDQPERELATLTEWQLQDGHLDLRQTLRGLYLAFYAAELVSLLMEEHDPHPEVFDQLNHLLGELGTPRAEQAFLSFQLEMLRETGYLPELTTCASCGQPVGQQSSAAFVAARGGVVCRACESTFPARLNFDGRLLGILQYFLTLRRGNGARSRLPGLSRHQTDPINRLVADHVEHTLGKRLRLRKYVLR